MDSSIAETSKKNPETSRDSSMAEPAQDQSIGDPSKENPETSMQKPESPKQNPEPPKQNPEPPQQNPETSEGSSSMAESCVTLGDLLKENPESSNQKPTNSFSFEIRPAAKLKHAIEALSNVPTHGRATLEVRGNGMKILASDESVNFVCYLYLKADDLINFEYNKPFNKWVDLEQILNILGVSKDGDKIQIKHVDGSDNLDFMFGELSGQYPVALYNTQDDYKEFNIKIHRIEAVIDCKDFGEIIEHVKDDTSKFVVFKIADGTVSVKVGKHESPKYEYKESIATRGLKYSARFRFVHCEFFRKALSTAKGVLICLVPKPPDSDSLIVRFNLGELGELVGMCLFADPGTVEKPAYSFSLQVQPASKLKYAIEALCYANPQGLGIIEVADDGMKILSGYTKKQLFCYLDFKAASLINFNYNMYFKKIVVFQQIFHSLDVSNDGDIITIQHKDGSDKLTFMIGELPCEDVVKLIDTEEDDFEVFPVIHGKLAFIIDWEDMRKIIRQVEAGTSESVKFSTADETLFIKFGKEDWKHKSPKIRRMRLCAEFQFHCKLLKKALLVAEQVLLCLGTDPWGSRRELLRLRFNLGELGDLVYMIKSVVDTEIEENIDPSVQKPETSNNNSAWTFRSLAGLP